MAKILIVDDELPIRRTLRDILEFEQTLAAVKMILIKSLK